MQIPQNKIPHIVFLFSDTGGGHRSAAEAILEAMSSEFPGKMTAELVDIFRDYAPTPLNRAAAIYPPLSRMPEMWGLGYKLSDGARQARTFTTLVWPYIRRASKKLVKENKCDLHRFGASICQQPGTACHQERSPKFHDGRYRYGLDPRLLV